MLGSYISAVLICAAALLVGRSTLAALGRDRWSWLEPAVGLAALLAVAGFLARAPGHATTAAVGVLLLLLGALLLAAHFRYEHGDALSAGLPVALVVLAALSIPFAVSGRYGLLGVGFNNDLGLHLAWGQWLKDGLGPSPDAGYPLGPHGLSTTLSSLPGIGLDQAFIGLILAISVITALTALAALRELAPIRRIAAAALVALAYLGVSYFAQSAFKETAEALFVLAFAIALPAAWPLPPDRRGQLLALGPLAVLAAGIVFSYSFAGLAWPIATVAIWSLSFAAVRRAISPRRLYRALARPATLAAVAILGAAVLVLGLVGPFGFADNFAEVQRTNTYGPVSPAEALGFWAAANYRLDTAGGAALPALTSAIAAIALLAGLLWWRHRRDYAVPAALAGGVLIYLATLNPLSGDYVRAKALMIIAPLVMLIAVRALLAGPAQGWRVPRAAWNALAVVFIAGAAYSSFLVLREAPVAPPGHGAQLRAFLHKAAGKSVLYAGQDRFAAWELRGTDTSVPVIEFPDDKVHERSTKPFDTGVSYSPIDFDSFSAGTLDSFDYVVTTAAPYASKAPPNFRPVQRTPVYILWKRFGTTPKNRRTLLEGGAPAAPLDCRQPETKVLISRPGNAALYPPPVVGAKEDWQGGPKVDLGEEANQSLELPAGRWRLSLQYFSPVGADLRAPGADFSVRLPAARDGQRPNQLTLFNDGQYWPVGSIDIQRPMRLRFTLSTDEPSTLQRLTGYDGQALLGELTAVPLAPAPTVPLPAACGSWVDHYSAPNAP